LARTENRRLPAPGWYRDPGGLHQHRYFDGIQWTDGVADDGQVSEGRLASAPSNRGQPGIRTADTAANLRRGAGWVASVGFVASLLLGLAGTLLGLTIAPQQQIVRLALGQAGLWTGLLATCWWASARHGTGSIRADFRVQVHVADAGRGLLSAVVARVSAAVVVAALYQANHQLVATDTSLHRIADQGRTAALTLAVIALIGAPLIEEIFFRGLVQQSLERCVGTSWAIVGQAAVFAAVHIYPAYGLGNVSVVITIAVLGLVLGATASRYQRLGPTIIAHAWFNLLPVIGLLVR
jgi:membrane protease YdiL (CAAX protease family)